MSCREAFEQALIKRARSAHRASDGESYADLETQAAWRTWQAAWQAAMDEVSEGDRVWVSRKVLNRVQDALSFYANPKSYEPARPGFLAVRPSGDQLSSMAKQVLADLRHPR